MLLARGFVTSATGGVSVGVALVVVPDRADVARVGFEEEFRHRVDAIAVLAAEGAVGGGFGVGHWAFEFPVDVAGGAGVVVLRHGEPVLEHIYGLSRRSPERHVNERPGAGGLPRLLTVSHPNFRLGEEGAKNTKTFWVAGAIGFGELNERHFMIV